MLQSEQFFLLLILAERESTKADGNDSVEGIMYNANEAVIMTGEFVEEEEVEADRINRMGRWYKPWFYKHVESFIKLGETVEYVPTLEFHQVGYCLKGPCVNFTKFDQ